MARLPVATVLLWSSTASRSPSTQTAPGQHALGGCTVLAELVGRSVVRRRRPAPAAVAATTAVVDAVLPGRGPRARQRLSPDGSRRTPELERRCNAGATPRWCHECMAISRTGLRPGPAGSSTGWYPVARSAEVGTTPVPVGAAARPTSSSGCGPARGDRAVPARCRTGWCRWPPPPWSTADCGAPPRLAVQRRGPVRGHPLAGPGHPAAAGRPAAPWAVEERDGWVWLAPDRTPSARPRPGGDAGARAACPPARPARPGVRQPRPRAGARLAPGRTGRRAVEGGYVQVRLLGRNWTVHRRGGAAGRRSAGRGVTERYGVVWIAPAEPRDDLLDVPGDHRPPATAAWLPRRAAPPRPGCWPTTSWTWRTSRSCTPARSAPRTREVAGLEVSTEPGGFRSVQERGSTAREDRGAGERPVRQRRRATYLYRAPFQLLLRLEELDSGAVRTVLFLLQPEDADSTRVYTCLLLHGIGGAGGGPAGLSPRGRGPGGGAGRGPRPAGGDGQRRAAAADCATSCTCGPTGSGVALRRALADLVADCAAADRAGTAAAGHRLTLAAARPAGHRPTGHRRSTDGAPAGSADGTTCLRGDDRP